MRFPILKILLACILTVTVIVVLSAKKQAGKDLPPSTTFYYYPKVNMYYDVVQENYIYKGDDGSWQTGKHVSDRISKGMGKKAVLKHPPLPVWKNNAHHRVVYSASLYASARDFRKDPPKPQPPVVAQTKKATEEKVEKKDSGIERFFKRIFKKKRTEDDKKKVVTI